MATIQVYGLLYVKTELASVVYICNCVINACYVVYVDGQMIEAIENVKVSG